MAETYGPPSVETLRLRSNGIKLHAAAGPPDRPRVVLLHGFPGGSHGWRRQIGPLAEAGLRVLALDLRGYSLSERTRGVRPSGFNGAAARFSPRRA